MSNLKTDRELIDEILLADILRQVSSLGVDRVLMRQELSTSRLCWHVHPEWWHLVLQLTDYSGCPVVQQSYGPAPLSNVLDCSLLGFPVYITTTARYPELRFP